MINIREINQAAAILKAGGLVAFPTETVYGLGADAANAQAVAKVFAAKGRPLQHPLIVHLADAAQIAQWASAVPEVALQLAAAFWPGPLTMVFAKRAHVLDVVTGGQATVALRVPQHPVAQALLRTFGGGVVAPSANQFTHVSPTDVSAVREELDGRVDMILDGGVCAVGVESTIVDVSCVPPVILRPGMITQAAIAAVLAQSIALAQSSMTTASVPGQHVLHYAPSTKTRMMTTAMLLDYVKTVRFSLAVLAYSDACAHLTVEKVLRLAPDAVDYAHDLYCSLRALDHLGVQEIVIEAVPPGGDWDAIRDRLTKASGVV